jgi:hypothetical protein
MYKVNFVLHLLCPQHHKNILKGISSSEKEVGSARLLKHPSIPRFLYLSANTTITVPVYLGLLLQLEREKRKCKGKVCPRTGHEGPEG